MDLVIGVKRSDGGSGLGWRWSVMYAGVRLLSALCVKRRALNLNCTGSQCNFYRIGVMWFLERVSSF